MPNSDLSLENVTWMERALGREPGDLDSGPLALSVFLASPGLGFLICSIGSLNGILRWKLNKPI